ncbi:Csu type fimbrial protein [Rhodanobacter sp. Col0626]|uniref:Csu type fimbrial protein n=1 Tax=Rhodanobacter sp. Col0626 TaxID=3415679 RepID=UPI003CF8D192
MMRRGRKLGLEVSRASVVNHNRARQRTLAWLMALIMGIITTPLAAAGCSLAATGVAFGNYDFLSPTDLEGVGNIQVQCDAVASYTITLSQGYGLFDARRMMSGAHQLSYNLYSDAARTIIWGDGIDGITQVVGGNDAGQTYPVYAKAPAGQSPYVGTYTDSITVTLTF